MNLPKSQYSRNGAAGLQDAYAGKTVVVTGHTGFKGSWLCEWLLMLGARVVGIALAPQTDPALFAQLRLGERLEHHVVDIRDRALVERSILDAQPDYLFHLAAQPLVRLSYARPVETYQANVNGTLHVLEALRLLAPRYSDTGRHCATVFITSDKCYENREWHYGYREVDALGGYDPYSSSKAAAEILISAYRRSYFNPSKTTGDLPIGVASARAGNVIGGGDWADDRIVPDCMRALQRGEAIALRNPSATRPWQHVLEPLGGYLRLASQQMQALRSCDREALARTCDAYNFGPTLAANRSVRDLVEEVLRVWPGQWTEHPEASAPHEAGRLNLVWDKAYHHLGWEPRWDFAETIARTVTWYRSCLMEALAVPELVREDIRAFLGNNGAEAGKPTSGQRP